MFTSKSIFLLITIIVLIAIAWNTDITMVYIFFLVSFVTFVLSFGHLYFNIPNVSIRRTLQTTAYEGDVISVKIDIQNKGFLSLYFFELVDRFTGAVPDKDKISLFILKLKHKEKKKIDYIAECYIRGLHLLGPITIVSQDALGFFKMRKIHNILFEILVYPTIFRIFNFPSLASGSVSWMGVETAKISGDSHEFFGVREYQLGDTMSRIHWPSTAHHNRLIVKQFERNAVQEVTIVIDLKKEHNLGIAKETTLEYSVKIAGSIARYLLNEGIFVQMVGYGKESMIIPFGKGESHMYKILEYLAKVRSEGKFSIGQVLDEVSFVTPHRSTLIAVILDNDIESLANFVQFRVKGIKLIIVVLATASFGYVKTSEYLDEEGAKRFDESLASLDAYVYRVSKGDDLEKKFEAI